MFWLILAALAALLIWYHFVRPMTHFKRMGVKQTAVWPLMGNQWELLLKKTSFAESVKSIYDMYPKERYMGYYQFSLPILILKDPELIKQLTVKDFDHFTDHRPFVNPETDPLWSNNLFSLTGQKWKEMRATLSGTFTSSKMKHMFGNINEAAQNFVEHFVKKNQQMFEIEMKDTFTRYTNDVIATTAFGLKVDSLENPENDFYMMGKRVTNFSNFKTQLKFILFFLTPRLFKYLDLSIFPRQVTIFFQTIIHDTIKVRQENNIIRQDMINLLLEARKGIKNEENDVGDTGFATVKESDQLDKYKPKQLKQLSNDDITSQALIFFIAGFDTISTALCFGAYELATNKEVQDKLRQEINKEHKNGNLTYDGLLKMKYLDMVFSEILRKWPPTVMIDRVCTKPYTIQPVNANEKPVHLKPGDTLWLPMHGLHRDPSFFPNPEKFDPERFSDENKQSINPYAYIPFGSGPRNCIGSRFAILEAKAMLYHLLLNFEIVPVGKTVVPLKLLKGTVQHTAENGFWLGLKRIQQ
ncbi:unnamed protein product [Ceutorhynchus assimilis]|uniref:Cytochrome P450 n=1 Tax=Ceutorhynchus assimilis TaxID=467358 RepID=A0A9N9MH01_9CUCU|nr:unnamed protein product [Ceutorhynchus assimilis]